jgi:peptidoglycan/LPS O-acetylase OafA/YrhL
MEGLRGFAVALVFLVHYTSMVGPWLDGAPAALAQAVNLAGNSGVDLFFVLSGYLIYGALIVRRQPFLAFMARRVRRIYPAFTVVFGIYAALALAVPGKLPAGGSWLYLAQNFLLLPGLLPIEPLITVAWSLSYEMGYYLALPALIAIAGLRRRSAAWRAGLVAALGAGLLGACALHGGPLRLAMFVAGMLLYEAAGRLPAPRGAVGLAALAAGLLGCMMPALLALRTLLLGVAFFALCLCCFGRPREWLGSAFGWTPLRWLGNMSYSYYLLHGLALKAAFLALPAGPHGPLAAAALLAPMFGWTLAPAAALFLAVERRYSLAPRAPGAPTRIPRGPGSP